MLFEGYTQALRSALRRGAASTMAGDVLYVLLFPLNVWVLELLLGHAMQWLHGHNVVRHRPAPRAPPRPPRSAPAAAAPPLPCFAHTVHTRARQCVRARVRACAFSRVCACVPCQSSGAREAESLARHV